MGLELPEEIELVDDVEDELLESGLLEADPEAASALTWSARLCSVLFATVFTWKYTVFLALHAIVTFALS